MEKNLFYCPDCGFEYIDDVNTGYFGEPIQRTVLNNTINSNRVDFLLSCPMCSGKNCGITVIASTEMAEIVNSRSIIALCKNLDAIRNM